MLLKGTPDRFPKLLDARFKKLHGTCDVIFCALHQSGIGANKTSAQVITDEDEEKLWRAGVLNITIPIGLQQAVFYYIGKACCLRGGEEQRGLKPSQFSHFMILKGICTQKMAQKTEMVDSINLALIINLFQL